MVLLHGWPGLPADYDAVLAGLPDVRVIVPDLRGMGAAFDGVVPVEASTAQSHADRVLASLDDAGIGGGVVIAGYDIGSRIAQAALQTDPDRFDGAVLTPAYPGIGDRAASPALASVFWYQHFHREPIAAELIDGDERAVRAYLTYLWHEWRADAAPPPHLDQIVAAYARPGAFAASLQWYVANRGYAAETGPITVPTTMLWPDRDPLFPLEWADNLAQHFTDARLNVVEGCGHFVPVERPDAVIRAIRSALR
ncbi:Hydrolase, alpha/beta domain protein [Microbacterium oleivorans]|uniref:Hydrolase, alpha/beta domain protein n=1 Tax=Microbacterium oleivorans TaxID=273677 RepID=A0A031FUZ6_9MICO|nr:Hydrolase, alpha/beta domain protein [Microbacterium oleivorans]